MRIIGGQFRGFRFDPGSKIKARPTTDRAKESLINILLSNYGIEGKSCLDLFAGTGNISFELASQGAAELTALDVSYTSVSFIKDTFQTLGFTSSSVIKADAFKWLKTADKTFDLIFADPPYDHIHIAHLPNLIFERGLLRENGLFILEHRTSLDLKHPRLKFKRDYGQSRFSFFE